MTVADAIKTLKEYGLEMQIQEETEELDKQTATITNQLPKQGIQIYEGTKIIVNVK